MRMLDERSGRIRANLQEAERLRDEAQRQHQEYQAQLQSAREDVRAMLNEANASAERVLSDAREQAERERQAALERAQAEIRRETDRAIQELRHEVASLAITAASRVLGEELDEQKHRQLVERMLDDVRLGNGRS
jgi:F-type H+-transporting ATPase subunit b